MPVFSVRVCSLGVAGSDGAVLAGVLSPIRSSRAEPGEEREHLFMILSTDWKRTHTCTYWAVAWLCHLLLHPPPAPAACTGWWPESGCRWLVRYPLQMEEDKRSHGLKDEQNINRADAHLRLRHYPPCRLLIWTAWASSFHSAGKDPGNRHSLVTLLPSWHASAGLNMLSWANFNEFLVALGAAVFAVALQQLAQQGDALLHLQDGIRPLWDFLHPFLVLRIKW